MITSEDKSKIQEISKKYHAKSVLLFGSSMLPDEKSNDIDIAVDGVAPKEFYRFCGDLLFSLSKPVDVIDLSGNSKFIQLIRREGIIIYG
jgi:predicted nucleotidyltransferase